MSTQQFHEVCAAGDLQQIDRLLVEDASLLDAQLDYYLPIQRAIPKHPEVVRRLLEAGTDVDSRVPAIHWFDWEMELLEQGISDWRIVHMAMIHGYDRSLDCIKVLNDFGCDFNSISMLRDRPIHLATTANWVNNIEFLISTGIEVDSRTASKDESLDIDWMPIMGQRFEDLIHSYEHTPLMLAAAEGFPESVECLLRHGADVNAANSAKMTPLHIAAGALWPDRHEQNLTNCQLLLNAGADRTAIDEKGRTPLDIATAKGYSDLVACLANS